MKSLLITAIVVIFILSVMFIPIRLYIRICYNNDGLTGSYSLFYGIIRLKKSGNCSDKTKKPKAEKTKKLKRKSILQILSFIKNNASAIKNMIYDVLGYMYKLGIKFDKIDIKLIIGTEDAMVTALSYGGISAFVYNTVAVLDRLEMLKKHRIELKTDFNNPHILTDDTAIISTNIFNISVLMFIIMRDGLPLLRKYKKLCASDTGKDEK